MKVVRTGRNVSLLAAGLALLGPDVRAERSFELSSEIASSSDVTLVQAGAQWKTGTGPSQCTFSIAGNAFALDYRPASFDFQGRARTLREESVAVQGAVRHRATAAWTLLGAAGVYDGFTNYRSVWLAEYYRQQYASVASLRNYREASPQGSSLSAGARWEYLPATAFAQLNFSWIGDEVAPGYEIDFDGLRRGPGKLNTTAVELAFENVATPRLRTLLALRAADTSGREVRLGFEFSANYALGDRWVLRGSVGGTREPPAFTGRHASLALEFALTGTVFLTLGGHLYRDTGEIENALLFTSAAPALRSGQWGVGLRGKTGRTAWRVSLSPLATRHAATNVNTDFFRHLYRGRNWVVAQAALAWTY